MSLKAYDGLMTTKGYKYIQDETLKRIDKFKNISLNSIAKTMAYDITKHIDGLQTLQSTYKFYIINNKYKEIIDINTTILSYVYQMSHILSKSNYINDYTQHLILNLEQRNKRILIYPTLCNYKHKNILLEYLDDWYAQNQVDKPDNVNDDEWNERCEDWWNYGNNKFFSSKIFIFNPNDIMDNINMNFRGEQLKELILKYKLDDKKRLRNIALNKLITKKLKEVNENNYSYAINITNNLLSENNTEIKEYIDKHNIKLIKFDKDLLNQKVTKFI